MQQAPVGQGIVMVSILIAVNIGHVGQHHHCHADAVILKV